MKFLLMNCAVFVFCLTHCTQLPDNTTQNYISETQTTDRIFTIDGISGRLDNLVLFKKSKILRPCGSHNICLCDGTYALCLNQGRKLDYIPQLPKYIVKLNFTGNYLPKLNSSTFTSLIDLKLKQLYLKANSFKSCDSGSFSDLKYLNMLIIANENISSYNLKNCLKSLNSNLKKLYLYSLNFTDGFQNEFFSEMKTHHVHTVSMRGSYIKLYNQTTFAPLKHLQSLMLSGCGIYATYPDYAPKLKWLTLNNNIIQTFPNFCKDGRSLYPNLTSLGLQSNNIQYIVISHISCLLALKNITLTDNALISIEGNTFSTLPKLYSLFIEHNTNPHMMIKAFAFNSSSLVNLFLNGNKLHVDSQQLNSDAFKNCENLRTLFLGGNNLHLHKASDENFNRLLAPLKNLRKLNIAMTRITYLPTAIPKIMKSLEVLYAHSNFISEWSDDYFHNLTLLKRLDLQQNQITVINKTSFSEHNLKSFELLGLGWNPYSCTCGLVWYIDYLIENNNSKVFEYYPLGYSCNTPIQWHHIQLNEVPLTQYLCFVKQISVNIISVTSTICVLVFCVSAVYRYRWHLRYFVYMIRFQQRRYQRHLQGPVYQYDLYLSCSENDFDFIYSDIVPRLEGELGQKLYIPQRDGTGYKVDGIISNMDVSRKAVLFVSESYTRDNYCEFEAMLAYDRYVSERRNMMIVVVLEEINALDVSKILHKILKVDQYIKWSWEEESIRLFWIKFAETVEDRNDLLP